MVLTIEASFELRPSRMALVSDWRLAEKEGITQHGQGKG
jgi:hypothetical protein